jgi:hypothetical protein
MKNKILGIGICILLLVTIVPIVGSQNTTTTPTQTAPLNELQPALIFGRYTNLTGGDGYITVETANMFAIYQNPRSFAHFPRGTQLTFSMYDAYGHIFRNIHCLYLHVQLEV